MELVFGVKRTKLWDGWWLEDRWMASGGVVRLCQAVEQRDNRKGGHTVEGAFWALAVSGADRSDDAPHFGISSTNNIYDWSDILYCGCIYGLNYLY